MPQSELHKRASKILWFKPLKEYSDNQQPDPEGG